MKIYRLTKEKYKDDLSGKGAETYGGCWNSKGTRILYAADSRALAKLEVAVNMPLNKLPKNYYMTTIVIPDHLISKYDINILEGKDWKNNPPIKFTQTEGDEFIVSGKALAMRIPSSVVQGDFNYLVNPQHKDANKIEVVSSEEFNFDMRLFKT